MSGNMGNEDLSMSLAEYAPDQTIYSPLSVSESLPESLPESLTEPLPEFLTESLPEPLMSDSFFSIPLAQSVASVDPLSFPLNLDDDKTGLSFTSEAIIASAEQFARNIGLVRQIEVLPYEAFLGESVDKKMENVGELADEKKGELVNEKKMKNTEDKFIDEDKLKKFICEYDNAQQANFHNASKFFERVNEILSNFKKNKKAREAKDLKKSVGLDEANEKPRRRKPKTKGCKNNKDSKDSKDSKDDDADDSDDSSKNSGSAKGARSVDSRPGYFKIPFKGKMHMPINTFMRRKGYPRPFHVVCMDYKKCSNHKSGKFFRTMLNCYWLGEYHPGWMRRKNLLKNPGDRATLIYAWLRKIRARPYKSLNSAYEAEFNGRTFFSPNRSVIEPNHRSFVDNGKVPIETKRGSSRLSKDEQKKKTERQRELLKRRLRNYQSNPDWKFIRNAPNEEVASDDDAIMKLVEKYGLQDVWQLTHEDVYNNFHPKAKDYVFRGKYFYVTKHYLDEENDSICLQVNRTILKLLQKGRRIKGIYLCGGRGGDDLKCIDLRPVHGVGIRSLEDWDDISDDEEEVSVSAKRKCDENDENEGPSKRMTKSRPYFADN